MLGKINLVRNAVKSSSAIRSEGIVGSFLRNSARQFSTDAENPNPTPTPTGEFYGRLVNGITKYTTRSDIINLLEGSSLTLDDVKVDYDRTYSPVSMMVHFPSKNDYDAALTVLRRSRLYRLERIDRAQWDFVPPVDGKAVLVEGIPRNAFPDDIERFLSGSQYDAASIQIFTRSGPPGTIPARMALVRFPSATLAMNAFLTKNRGFCLNSQLLLRVLH